MQNSQPVKYEAVAALLAATARGVRRPLLVLPTGTGKTIVFALLVQRRRGRSLILAHRDELIQQAVDKLRLVDPTLPLGVVQAARDEHTAPTVVASVQTLSRRTRLSRLVPESPHSLFQDKAERRSPATPARKRPVRPPHRYASRQLSLLQSEGVQRSAALSSQDRPEHWQPPRQLTLQRHFSALTKFAHAESQCSVARAEGREFLTASVYLDSAGTSRTQNAGGMPPSEMG